MQTYSMFTSKGTEKFMADGLDEAVMIATGWAKNVGSTWIAVKNEKGEKLAVITKIKR